MVAVSDVGKKEPCTCRWSPWWTGERWDDRRERDPECPKHRDQNPKT